MRLKDWAFLGNYEFFTNKLQLLATNDLPPEKWSYAGKNDFGILKNYLYFIRKIVERAGFCIGRGKETFYLYG